MFARTMGGAGCFSLASTVLSGQPAMRCKGSGPCRVPVSTLQGALALDNLWIWLETRFAGKPLTANPRFLATRRVTSQERASDRLPAFMRRVESPRPLCCK